MSAQTPLAMIEAKRMAAGISVDQLVAAAGLTARGYLAALAGRRTPRPTTIGKLRLALSRLARVQSSQDDLSRLVASAYHAALALLCDRAGILTADVLRHDPTRRATANREWREAARMRQRAIALVNQGLDLPQSELARALGLTPAAISLAMRDVEDARHDDPSLDRMMDELERLLRGDV